MKIWIQLRCEDNKIETELKGSDTFTDKSGNVHTVVETIPLVVPNSVLTVLKNLAEGSIKELTSELEISKSRVMVITNEDFKNKRGLFAKLKGVVTTAKK